MTRLKLRRGASKVCKRIELVHIINDEGAVACGLEGGVDLIFASNGGFPLRSEEGKVCISVVDNVEPVAGVSQKLSWERRATYQSAMSSSSRVNGMANLGECVAASVLVIYPRQLSGCGLASEPQISETVDRGGGGE
jgi:hypothetical protein